MWIVAIGWMYVVTLMAATEPTVVGGIMTFFRVWRVAFVNCPLPGRQPAAPRSRTRQDSTAAGKLSSMPVA
jgi:hypothetical protein